MRILRKTIVVALAAFGVYRAWELLSPKLDKVRDRPTTGGGPGEPAWSNATESVEDASRDAAVSLAKAARDAADASTATVDLTREESGVTSPAPSAVPADSTRGTATP
jgi:hypothetical protein